MDDYGFVYFLSNQSMPGLYKIGFTTKHPRLRMAELASSTGCPCPFTLLAYFGAPCPQRIESTIHRAFANCRVNYAREFFQVDAVDMARMVDHFSAKFGDSVFRAGLDDLCAGRKYELEPEPVAPIKPPEKTEEEKELEKIEIRKRFADLRAILTKQPQESN